MLIGIDASRANNKLKTGTEWYSFNVIQELKKIIPNDYQVVLYSKEKLRDGLEELPKNWKSKILSWPFRFFWTQIRFSLEMMKYWSNPDILYIPAHTIPLIHPNKTILVAHDVGFEKFEHLYNEKDLNYHKWAMRYAVRHAHKIITVSDFSKKEIVDFYNYPEDKISVVHNGFNSQYYYSLKNKSDYLPILKKYNLETPFILFVGRLEIKKNIPKLIEAFAILKQKYKIKHKLVLIGLPSFKYEDVKKEINKHKLNNEVIEVGYTETKDINVVMNFADLFVFPSLYEGFGIPILEAMSCGTPVACSDIPALKEVAADAAHYFNPNNENDIAEKIFELLNNTNEKTQLINKGALRVKNFSYQKCAEETWKIISCKNS